MSTFQMGWVASITRSKNLKEDAMPLRAKRFKGVLSWVFVLVMVVAWQPASAQDDVAHAISGLVKSIDKGAKTMVVKTADGTEHTIKYTDQTVVAGAKDTGKSVEKASVDTYLGAKVGSKVTVKYTEKAGEKTAVGVKEAGKATAKAVTD
jgi:hypothetical protein